MHGARLLAVDQDVNLSDALRTIAESGGHELEIVDRPSDFLRRFPTLRPDVVVFGLVMRDMDGLELLARLVGQVDRLHAIVITRPDCPYREAARSLADAHHGENVAFVTRSLDEAVFRRDLSQALAALVLRRKAGGAIRY